MTELIRQNAVIKSTMFGIEDHGILSFSLGLDYGGVFQHVGGIALSGGNPTQYMARGLELLLDILEVVGVRKWEDLVGKPVVGLDTDDRLGTTGNVGIENYLGTKRMIWKDYA